MFAYSSFSFRFRLRLHLTPSVCSAIRVPGGVEGFLDLIFFSPLPLPGYFYTLLPREKLGFVMLLRLTSFLSLDVGLFSWVFEGLGS